MFKRNSAEVGLSSCSAINFGFAAVLAGCFFDLDFPFPSGACNAGLEVNRFRDVEFLEGLASAKSTMSFHATLLLVVVAVLRAEKKPLATLGAACKFADSDAYCSVTRSVMVRGFFLGAFPFSGEDGRDATRLPGTSTSYIHISINNLERHPVVANTSILRLFVTPAPSEGGILEVIVSGVGPKFP